MLVTFANEYLEKLYHQQKVPGKPKYDQSVIDVYIRRVDQFIAADNSNELRGLKSLHFEALKGDKQGLYSVRVNRQYRIEFRLTYDQVEHIEVVYIEDLSNHYR
ncbi:type II toxin-antitoxin system RelE/ParE family toxin [Spirosoma areae]